MQRDSPTVSVHEECTRRAAAQMALLTGRFEAKNLLLTKKVAELQAKVSGLEAELAKGLDPLELRTRLIEDARREVFALLEAVPPKGTTRTTLTEFEWAVRSARRGRTRWQLSEGEWRDLTSRPCHYCEGPLGNTGIRLDRLKNDIGYRRDNVVPSCARCSTARGKSFTSEQMKRVSMLLWSDHTDRG